MNATYTRNSLLIYSILITNARKGQQLPDLLFLGFFNNTVEKINPGSPSMKFSKTDISLLVVRIYINT